MNNKFVLKIKLTSNQEYGLEITIIHWDKRYLSYSGKINNPFDLHIHNGFVIYSQGNGKITNTNIFRIPSLDKLKNNHILSCNFYNDEYRYTYLKQLFYCLQDWGLKQNELNKFKEPLYNKKIIVNGEFWVM